MSGKAGALLAAAEEAEERCVRCGRLAARLDRLALALYASALLATAAYLFAYLLHGLQLWHVAGAGLALWIAYYAARILRDVCSIKAAEAARQECVFRRTAEIITEIEKIRMKLEKKIELEKKAEP